MYFFLTLPRRALLSAEGFFEMKKLLFLSGLALLYGCATRPKGALDTGYPGTTKTTYNWKQPLIGAGLAAVSGACWGVHETVVHHPDRIPDGWNRQFWDNRLSWRNKYAGGQPENGPRFLGATTFLAWTTDAKHLFATAHRATLFAAGVTVTIGERRPWWHYAADIGISYAAYTGGFHGVYSLLF